MQTTVRMGLKGCKIYHPRTPSWAIRYLVELGNIVNNDSEGTTFLQIYRSTENIEASFGRRKEENHWTVASIGQGAMESKKMELARKLCPGRWTGHASYEKCFSFYRDAQKLKLPDGTTLWTAYSKWAMENCDFKVQDSEIKTPVLFANNSLVLKAIGRKDIELTLSVLKLFLPWLPGKGQVITITINANVIIAITIYIYHRYYLYYDYYQCYYHYHYQHYDTTI